MKIEDEGICGNPRPDDRPRPRPGVGRAKPDSSPAQNTRPPAPMTPVSKTPG